MSTDSTSPLRRRPDRIAGVVVALATLATVAALALPPRSAGGPEAAAPEPDAEGRDVVRAADRPGIEAAFQRESYARGQVARLALFEAGKAVELQMFRVGATPRRSRGPAEMLGLPVTKPVSIGSVRRGQTLRIPVGNWPGGLYFARLTAAGGRIGYAPFTLRPRHLGEHRVAVVLPTYTWQAYNFRDDDGDGREDTWYAHNGVRSARLFRPFENRGVPPHYRGYDEPFLRWLAHSGREADYLAQSDMTALRDGAALARAYDFIVFPGHHEYVSTGEYDAVTDYRNRGGHLAFLSANNFFARIDVGRASITRTARWRDIGRPEAALVGIQYIGWDTGTRRGPWTIGDVSTAPWLFRATGLHRGSRLASAGIEIDKAGAASPRGLRVLAEIRDLFGPGMTAQMSYYETPRGAMVFAAGAFTLAGSVAQPAVRQMLENLWSHMTPERRITPPRHRT